MKKIKFPTELCYVFGMILVALSAAAMSTAGFGVSMVVAPAYLLHLRLVEFLPFFSFGMAEYTIQALLLIILMIIMRKFKWSYLFSFVTAIIYGLILDGCIALLGLIPLNLVVRIFMYVIGVFVCSFGIALMFNTYITQEVYELFVKEVSEKFNFSLTKVKTCFDLSCVVVAIIFSFLFFGNFNYNAIGIGTVVCAFFNGFFIGIFNKLLLKSTQFYDALPLRKYFER